MRCVVCDTEQPIRIHYVCSDCVEELRSLREKAADQTKLIGVLRERIYYLERYFGESK